MVNRIIFEKMEDGDHLTQGYYNGIHDMYSITGKNMIRQLQDRSIDFSVAQDDMWGDAYIDTTGQINTVNTGSTTATFDTDKYKYNAADSIIVHTIPTGTFSNTISNGIGIPLIEDWEDGADIQYKLTNATEDTDWLDCSNSSKISTFTAFTSEPTELTVKLIPTDTSPTSGYPSINGFVIRVK